MKIIQDQYVYLNLVIYKNFKHIEVQDHYNVNKNDEKGIIEIVKIEYRLNVSDMLSLICNVN